MNNALQAFENSENFLYISDSEKWIIMPLGCLREPTDGSLYNQSSFVCLFFNNFICLVSYFGLCWVFLLQAGFLQVWPVGDTRAFHCRGFSCFRAQALGCAGLSSCSSWAAGSRAQGQ